MYICESYGCYICLNFYFILNFFCFQTVCLIPSEYFTRIVIHRSIEWIRGIELYAIYISKIIQNSIFDFWICNLCMFSHISVIFHFYWERWNSSEFVTNLMMGFSWSLKSYLSIVCILSSTIYLHVSDVVNNMIGNVMWSILWLLMRGRQLNYMLLTNWTHLGWFKRDLKLEWSMICKWLLYFFARFC